MLYLSHILDVFSGLFLEFSISNLSRRLGTGTRRDEVYESDSSSQSSPSRYFFKSVFLCLFEKKV